MGFFGSLLDLSFRRLITTQIIKVIYVLSLALIALWLLVLVIAAFDADPTVGVVTLIFGVPIVGTLAAVYVRVVLEFAIAVFRILETNQELVALEQARSQPAGAQPGA